MTNIIVAKKRIVNVSANGTGGVIDSTTPVTIKAGTSVGGGSSRIDAMSDVIPTGEVDGATLVYDPNIGKYVVRKLTLDDLSGGALDGGTF